MSRLRELLREELRDQVPYGAPQLDVPVALNTNESSYEVPAAVVDSVVRRVAEAAPHLNRYPDREASALRAALADYLRRVAQVSLHPDQIWAANGSNEILAQVMQAFGGPDRPSLGFTPTYSMHSIIVRSVGSPWIDGQRGTSSGQFDLDLADVLEQVRRHRPGVVFLCSPNNPTGTALGPGLVEEVYAAAEDAVVVVDEAYAEFARPGTQSALSLLPGRERLVVTRTMSKAFSFAGLRLGYMAADPELVDLLRLVRLPYHLSTLTQVAAQAALEHAEQMLGMVAAIRSERDRLVTATRDLGLRPVPSDANFVLVGGFADAPATWQALLEQGVLVRDVGIPGHLRITAGTPAETDAVLRALAHLAPTHRQESA